MIQWTSIYNNFQNQYIIPNQWNNKERELNVQTNIKTKNRKKLQLYALVDSGCSHTGINKQLVKEEKIKTEPMNRLFEVFNTDKTKNGEVIWYTPLKVKINKHKENINVAVMDLNGTDMFLGYNWLVKHNLEVNWNMEKIWFTRCPRICRTQYQDILFKTRRIQPIDNQNKEH